MLVGCIRNPDYGLCFNSRLLFSAINICCFVEYLVMINCIGYLRSNNVRAVMNSKLEQIRQKVNIFF
jgi:hypothetical protein